VAVFEGTNGNDSLTGGQDNDELRGGAGNDTLIGNDGDDQLYGDAGDDRMVGGNGSDIYFVDGPGDVVVEEAGGGDNDNVLTTISYTLGAHIERAQLFDGNLAFSLTGNDLDNSLSGNRFANQLFGGVGNDTLYGAEGADTWRAVSATTFISSTMPATGSSKRPMAVPMSCSSMQHGRSRPASMLSGWTSQAIS
jgi:Ca2+-binding RTX toxin-like protein